MSRIRKIVFNRKSSLPLDPPHRQRGQRVQSTAFWHVFDSIWHLCHIRNVGWAVEIIDEFEPEFSSFSEDVRIEILALTRLLQQFGPQLGRPRVDTLKGSKHRNMKELRFSAAGGEWRVAFAFDAQRKAILLVAGDKSGVSVRKFYRELIRRADRRFDAHLARLTTEQR